MPEVENNDRSLSDRVWRGYDLRAAVPLIAVAIAASGALLCGRWYLGDAAATLAPYAIVLAIWPGLLGPSLYRAITYTYRITDQALLIDRGFFHRPEPPLWLKDVAQVGVGTHWLGRQLGIGWVEAAAADGRVVMLTAVRHPAEFAAHLKEMIGDAKAP